MPKLMPKMPRSFKAPFSKATSSSKKVRIPDKTPTVSPLRLGKIQVVTPHTKKRIKERLALGFTNSFEGQVNLVTSPGIDVPFDLSQSQTVHGESQEELSESLSNTQDQCDINSAVKDTGTKKQDECQGAEFEFDLELSQEDKTTKSEIRESYGDQIAKNNNKHNDADPRASRESEKAFEARNGNSRYIDKTGGENGTCEAHENNVSNSGVGLKKKEGLKESSIVRNDKLGESNTQRAATFNENPDNRIDESQMDENICKKIETVNKKKCTKKGTGNKNRPRKVTERKRMKYKITVGRKKSDKDKKTVDGLPKERLIKSVQESGEKHLPFVSRKARCAQIYDQKSSDEIDFETIGEKASTRTCISGTQSQSKRSKREKLELVKQTVLTSIRTMQHEISLINARRIKLLEDQRKCPENQLCPETSQSLKMLGYCRDMLEE